jgi:hypothetical protein
MVWPKIIYPAQPAVPLPPAASSVAGGSLGARTYYWLVSFVTAYGVSLPCPEQSVALPASNLCQIASPAAPSLPTVASGWNVYASSAMGEETLQNSSPIAIGTAWTEPSGGLVTGSAPPTTWGATLQFRQFPRFVPYAWSKAIRHDSFSTAGARQTVVERLEDWLKFTLEWVASGADVAAWDMFLRAAVQGMPFDYYPDAFQANYLTYALMDFEKSIDYKAPGKYYTFTLTMRKEMLQLVSAPGGGVPPVPTSAARWVTFTSSAPGPFTVAHELGYSPNGVSAPILTNAGAVFFQTPPWDATKLYLVASAPGISGMVLVW